MNFSFFTNFLGREYGANSVADYAQAVIIAGSIFLFFIALKYLVAKKIARFAAYTATYIDDVGVRAVMAIGWPLALIVGITVAVQTLTVPNVINRIFTSIAVIFLTYYIARSIFAAIDFAISKMHTKDPTILELLAKIIKGGVVLGALLLILQNLGYNVNTLLTGLGIGGIAIAFALQNVLGDILAAVSIYLDKPFSVGDTITVGSDSGTVRSIGLKSTRLVTPQGQELIISNKELTETRVQNFKRMNERHVKFNLVISYATTSEMLNRLPSLIENVIRKIPQCTFEMAYVSDFGDYGFIFEVSYKIDTSLFSVHTAARHAIAVALKKLFDQNNIVIATKIVETSRNAKI